MKCDSSTWRNHNEWHIRRNLTKGNAPIEIRFPEIGNCRFTRLWTRPLPINTLLLCVIPFHLKYTFFSPPGEMFLHLPSRSVVITTNSYKTNRLVWWSFCDSLEFRFMLNKRTKFPNKRLSIITSHFKLERWGVRKCDIVWQGE